MKDEDYRKTCGRVLFDVPVIYLADQTKEIEVFSEKYQKKVKINEGPQTKPIIYLMMHQTAGKQKIPISRWLTVKSHLGIAADGDLVLIHALGDKVRGSLQGCVSVEVAGCFPSGVRSGKYAKQSIAFDKKNTDKLTEAQKTGIMRAIDLFIACGLALGYALADLQLIFHENTFASRIFDPGQEIALFTIAYARSRGMKFDPKYKRDSGSKTHPEWIPNATA